MEVGEVKRMRTARAESWCHAPAWSAILNSLEGEIQKSKRRLRRRETMLHVECSRQVYAEDGDGKSEKGESHNKREKKADGVKL
jgi:hypothetical protein